MSELTSLGVILLLALLAGHLVKFLRIPEVTGYILAGVVLGPSVLDAITHDAIRSLAVFSQVALGLILFSIGAVFEFERFRTVGRRTVLLTLIESTTAAVLVAGGLLIFGARWQVALLLGVIAMETAAASTLMVMREVDAKGLLTETLTGIIAINNLLCLGGYLVVSAGIELHALATQGELTIATLYRIGYPLVWQTVGSAALGFLVGILLSTWASKVVEQGETLILLAGCILLSVGVATALDLSPLVTSLAVGATMVNLSGKSRRLFDVLSHTDPPLYAIFFVIAGADLNLGLLPSLGMLGVIYVVGRTIGKVVGTRTASRRLGAEEPVQRYLGFAMLSQAGLAIGLLLSINQRFPELAPTVTTVVLAAVTIFELVGPVGARRALVRAGEAKG